MPETRPDPQPALRAATASQHAPLSARKALLAAVLFDHLSDAAYAQRADLSSPLAAAGDILAFRATLRGLCPAQGALMDLVECGAQGPRLQVMPVRVPDDGFARLPVADLMVSLYNSGTVPRLMLVRADGSQVLMQDLLQQTAAWWQATLT